MMDIRKYSLEAIRIEPRKFEGDEPGRLVPTRKGAFAEYLLSANRKAIGVVEAKPEGRTLTAVEMQSAKYTFGLPEGLPHYHVRLRFAYEFAAVTQFMNALDPGPRGHQVFAFHPPGELVRLATLERHLRAALRSLPELRPSPRSASRSKRSAPSQLRPRTTVPRRSAPSGI